MPIRLPYKITLLLVFFWGALFSPSSGLGSGHTAKENNALVRIAVLKAKDEITLELKSPYVIADPVNFQELKKGRRLKNLRVKVRPDGMEVGGDLYKLKKIRVTSKDNVGVLVDGTMRRYRGAVDILFVASNNTNSLTAVNVIDLEE
jgi:hypothetical protein